MKSFVPDLERDLVLAFMLGKINEQKFLERFQDDPAQRTLTWLEGAFRACDPLATELALSLGHRFGFTPEALPWLHRLAVVDWHTRHEDVVSALSKLAASESVDTLYATALAAFPYREYDEFQTLGVKCIWALYRIASLEAVARLGDLTRAPSPILVHQAKRLLKRLAEGSPDESIRKAAAEVGS